MPWPLCTRDKWCCWWGATVPARGCLYTLIDMRAHMCIFSRSLCSCFNTSHLYSPHSPSPASVLSNVSLSSLSFQRLVVVLWASTVSDFATFLLLHAPLPPLPISSRFPRLCSPFRVHAHVSACACVSSCSSLPPPPCLSPEAGRVGREESKAAALTSPCHNDAAATSSSLLAFLDHSHPPLLFISPYMPYSFLFALVSAMVPPDLHCSRLRTPAHAYSHARFLFHMCRLASDAGRVRYAGQWQG